MRYAQRPSSWILIATLAAIGVGHTPAMAGEVGYFRALATDLRALVWDTEIMEFRATPVALFQPESTQPPLLPGESLQPPLLPSESVQPPLLPGFGAAPTFDDALFNQLQQETSGFITGLSRTETMMQAPTDIGRALQQSNDINTVSVQQRSPVSLDPHIRGYRVGQIYTQADGAAYFPVRMDLDTVLSKIDPTLIQNVVVVPGPYGLRYGPGFAFIDVQTIQTGRYCNGYEWHSRTGLDYRTNGEQIYGRETVWGGSSDWGYIFSYGNRTGNDYLSGNGVRVPSSYHVQNFSLQLGFDLSPDSRIEYRLARLDQTNTEYAAQIFDLNFLAADAVTVNYVNEAPLVGDRNRVDLWWNNSRFGGDTRNASKQSFNVINRIDAALQVDPIVNDPTAILDAETSGDFSSTGVRDVLTFGNQQDGDAQVDISADARYLTQSTVESFRITQGPGGADVATVPPFFTNQPQSEMLDVGGFAELTLPWLPYFKSSLGYRLDYVHTDAQEEELRDFIGLAGSPGSLPQNDMLHAVYLLNDLEMTDVWSTRFGVGHAQRAPTLTDRYADGIFLGIIQSGFSRVIGDPNLAKERAWQADVGLKADYDVVRGEISLFYSWINNYITYRTQGFDPPTGARLLTTVNTPLATLTGFNFQSEADLTQQTIGFLTFTYVDGRDQTIGAPLPQISPLESRAGLRFKSFDEGQTWGAEAGARMVATQNRLGTVRSGAGVDVLETRTAGFTTFYLRGYYNWSENLHFVGGVENLFDRQYLEHLDLRLPAQALGNIPPTSVFAPGVQPYVGVEYVF